VIQHIACDPDDRDADRNTQFMQDLLLAQQRDRPAYCFQHLDLDLRSHMRFLDGGDRANCAAPGATLAPWCEVVARFGPEWNSLGVNKTRSFNILGEFMMPDTVLLHSLRQRKLSSGNPAQGEVKFS
jgi:hypothetical protein